MKLWEIADELQALLAQLDDGGELTPELVATLDTLQGDLATKTERICQFIRNLQADYEARKAEADRLSRLAQANARAVEGLKGYLKAQLERIGQTRIETTLFKVRIQRNGQPSVRCDVPLDSLPPDLVIRKEVLSLDTVKMIELAKTAPAALPSGVRVETGTHLRIS